MVKGKKVRLKDIAYALNVSVTCVSRSLRDCSDISEDTKKLIRQKAIELGYHSKYNEIKTKEKFVVALVFDSLKNPYFTKLGNSLISRFNKEKYDFLIMIAGTNAKVDDTLVKKCIYRNADVILSFNEFNDKAVELANLNDIPLISVGRIPNSSSVNAIYTKDGEGGEIAFKYLYGQNKKNLLYIDELKSEASYRRYQGFKLASNSCNEVKIFKSSTENLLEALDVIIVEKIDGIFTYNDKFSYKIMKLLESKNIDYKNILFVGYDNDLEFIKDINKDFKTIDFDYDEIALKVIEIIKNILVDKKTRDVYRHEIEVKLL